MSETRFTPGPWFITGKMTKFIEAKIGRGLIKEVAACGPADADEGYGQQQIANAQLIAAAPDLYDALQDAIELLSSAEIQESVRARGMAQVIKHGDKALRKARGES